MKRGFLLSVILLLACQEQKPKFTDAQMRKVRIESPWMTEQCLEKMRWGGIEAVTGNCTRRFPPARWRGLWRDEFEGSLFCPAPAQKCPNARSLREGIWLTLEPRPASVRHASPGGVYAVEFIGRRTAAGSPYDAYGYAQEMIVDRLISIQQVEPPPPQPTKEEMDAWWRACRANHTCIPNLAAVNEM